MFLLPNLIQKYPLDITQKQKNYLENYKCYTLSMHSLCTMLRTLCSLCSLLSTALYAMLSLFLSLSFFLSPSLPSSHCSPISVVFLSLYIFLSLSSFSHWLVLFSCFAILPRARMCEKIA